MDRCRKITRLNFGTSPLQGFWRVKRNNPSLLNNSFVMHVLIRPSIKIVRLRTWGPFLESPDN